MYCINNYSKSPTSYGKNKSAWNIQQEYDFPDVWLDGITLMSALCHVTEAGTRLERKMGLDVEKRRKWKYPD